MPQLDVSVALTNWYTIDTLTVQRSEQVVNSFGESKISVEMIHPVYGVVYAMDPNDLDRQSDMQVTGKTIGIATKFALRGESDYNNQPFQPDVVLWHGDSYLVKSTEDYSNYAAGFIMAKCAIVDHVATAPVTR